MSKKNGESAPAAGRPSREKKVKLADGFTVVMRPLQPDRMDAVMGALSTIAAMHEQKMGPLQIFAAASREVTLLLDECVEKGVDFDLADIPIVLSVFLDQNLNDATLAAWKELQGRLVKIMPQA